MIDQENVYEVTDLVEQPQATILLTHGLGEHIHRYDHFVKFLNENRISVFRYDLPGHGRTRTGDWLFDDANVLIDTIRHKYRRAQGYSSSQNIPLFLMGQSLGALITANFVSVFQPYCEGVLLSAPALSAGQLASNFVIKILKQVKYFFPRLPYLKIPPEHLSHVVGVGENYKNDPLVFHGKINLQTGYEILTLMKETNANVENFQQPVLILHGSKDKIIPESSSLSFFNRLVIEDKTLQLYPGMYHEILNEINREKVYEDIFSWIESRI